ncbi:MAG: tRNA-dependent cyclodipeptide synthase [bacterium]
MQVKECSPVGIDVIQNKGAIIIGVSINNSYFKESNLTKIISWSATRASNVYIMIPDTPSVSTLIALGYEQNKAETLARLKSNSLENKCLFIIKELNLDNIKIIRWRDLIGRIEYVQAIGHIKYFYDNDLSFKDALRKTTSDVLKHNMSDVPSESQIDIGVVFLLQELAFICHADSILKEEKLGYLYHNTMDVLKGIIENRFSFKTKIGFITAE